MSSFSSVVQKPGKKIVPKAAPRRNVQRRTQPEVALAARSLPTPDAEQEETTTTSSAVKLSIALEAQNKQGIQGSETTAQRSQESLAPETHDVVQKEHSKSNAPERSIAATLRRTVEVARSRSPPVIEDGTIEHPQVGSNNNETRHTPAADGAQESRRDALASNPTEDISSDAIQPSFEPTIPVTRPKRQRKVADLAQVAPGSRKKRKITPRAAPALALSQTRSITPISGTSSRASVARSRPSTERNSQGHASDDLFQSATRRAATVSELANSIETHTRSLRPRAQRTVTYQSSPSPDDDDLSDTYVELQSPSRPKRHRKTAQQQAIEVVTNAIGKSGGSTLQRDVTPENAEEYELEPTQVTMGELCEDKKLGKKSALETEMQANWAEILQRRKEDRERAIANAEKRRRKGIGPINPLDTTLEPVTALAPAMAVVNGVIVVDQASREIDRAAQVQQAAAQNLDNVREDRDYYKYVNQSTVGMKPGHGRSSAWDEDTNERFYKGLRMFGTDFLMIATMFPGLTRKQIKTKFIREEKANRLRVFECLQNREPMDLEDYAVMANKETEEFHTFESIQKELDEQEKRLREEDNERRKREGFTTTNEKENDAPQAPPDGVEDASEGQTASAEPGRFDAAARDIVQAAVVPKKRQRKTLGVNSRRGLKSGRRIEGGVEEMLGSINDFTA